VIAGFNQIVPISRLSENQVLRARIQGIVKVIATILV
jgi:hypothetical protein